MLFAVTMTAATAWTIGLLGAAAAPTGPVRTAWAQDRAHLADLAAAQTAARTGTTHTPTSTRSQALQTRNNPPPTTTETIADPLTDQATAQDTAQTQADEGPGALDAQAA